MSNNTFIHLQIHTEFSLLDGLSRIKSLVARAKELDMPALAITDHGTMFGVMDFYNACINADIKPIIGVEAYLARRGMEDRDPQPDKRPDRRRWQDIFQPNPPGSDPVGCYVDGEKRVCRWAATDRSWPPVPGCTPSGFHAGLPTSRRHPLR